MVIKLPESIKRAIKKGYILSIIQFGSSLRKSKYQDTDLAIIIKKGCYKNFLEIVYGENFKGFDISLIKEREVQGPEKFRFGKHGAHFLFSLIHGEVLYSKNPFWKFKVSEYQIKKSVFISLFDYIEDVRRAVFRGKIDKNIKRRWPKFLKLSLYLLDTDLKYLEALRLNKNEMKKYLVKYKIDFNIILKKFKNQKNLLVAYETMWEKVLKKRKLIRCF